MLKVMSFPESQSLMELQGFADNCRLVNGERGIAAYGLSAYLVDDAWLQTAKPVEEEEYEETIAIYDDELEDLGLL